MRSLLTAAAFAAFVAAPLAQAQGPAALNGTSSDNVEHVASLKIHFDSAGLRILGKLMYITTERDLSIYDVSVPETPKQLGSLLLSAPGEPTLTEEDPDTNGRILLVSNAGSLLIIDVSEPNAPKQIAELADADHHTWSCVLDCTYAYGSEGAIVDLRDPRKPKFAGDWREQYAVASTHDLTEFAPGRLITATEPIMLLDARSDPAKPALMATGKTEGRFIHQAAWANKGADDMLLTAGESIGPGCSEDDSATFTTWRTTGWEQTKTFTPLHRYSMTTGLPTEGRMPETTWCTHWFDVHPSFRNGGLAAIAWYEHGTRFLAITPDGQITEIGWFIGYGGQASQVRFVSDRIAYVADYTRGLDIIRFTGEIPAPGPAPLAPTPIGTPTPPAQPAPPAPTPPRFSALVAVPRCAAGRVRVKDARVVKLTVHAGRRKLGESRRSVLIRKPGRVRITATLSDGTRLAAVKTLRRCKRR